MKTRAPSFVHAVLTLCWFTGAAPCSADPAAIKEPAPIETTGSELIISALDNEQYLPAVAYNPHHDEYLVVWQNNWGGNKDIYASRVGANGQVISWYAVTYGANDRVQPAVAYDPGRNRYLVVWGYDYFGDGSDWDIWGRFLPWYGPDPTEPEFSIVATTSDQSIPKVVFAQTQQEFLVVWENYSSITGSLDIWYNRIYADGSGFPSVPSVICQHTDVQGDPDAAYNLTRNEYLVTWSQWDTSGVDTWAVRLAGDASVLGGGEFQIADGGISYGRSTLAACRLTDAYMVLYERFAASQFDIFGREVTGDGSVNPSGWHIAITTNDEASPNVTCDPLGREFVSVWEREISGARRAIDAWFFDHVTYQSRIENIITSPTGELFDPVVAAGRSTALVVYSVERAGTSWIDIHGVLVERPWIFFDSFESGATNYWSSTVP